MFGLIFDVSNKKFYLNIDGTNTLTANDLEYADQTSNWNSSNNTLYLNNFVWETPALVALTITGGDLNMNIEGTNSFVSTLNGAATSDSYGISSNDALNVSGSGMLNATGGATSARSAGINGNLIITDGTVTATSGTAGTSQAILGSVTPPAAYTYWTNTDPSDPGGAGMTYPGGTPYSYSTGDKFVKLMTKNNLTLTLTASPDGSLTLPGDVVLTATLAGAVPLDGQTITFTVNGSNAGTGTTDGSGAATYTVTSPAAGTYSFGATFAGDANNVPATAQDIAGYVVSRIASDMSLTASAGATFNDDVTLTAMVSGMGAGMKPALTGTVTFMQGGDTLATLTPAAHRLPSMCRLVSSCRPII